MFDNAHAHAPLRADFRSRDTAALEAYLDQKQYRFRPAANPSDPEACEARILSARLPGVDLSEISYGREAETWARAEQNGVALHLPLGGSARWRGRGELVCGGRSAVITSTGERQTARISADCRRLVVCAHREALTATLATLLGEAVWQPVVFAPAIDLGEERYRSLLELAALAQGELARPGTALGGPLAASWFEQALLSALVLLLPHSYSARLDGAGPAPAPRDVKRAVDFIEAHLDQPLALADIAAAAGVPGRTLRHHFRRFKGLAPMAYVRKARLERARRDLERGEAGVCVTEVARRWGFDHLGRFAGEYRRSFGVPPSRTLRLARGR